MRIPELYARKHPVFSFEFFPPQSAEAAQALFETISGLVELAPDFVSVTCPGDPQRRPLTFELVTRIKRELGVEAMAHLVTVGYTRDQLGEILEHVGDKLGSELEISVEVRAKSKEGFDDGTRRIVSENSKNLDANAAEFE